MKRLLREPLLHFVVLGLVISVVHRVATREAGVSAERIVVDDETLLAYLQYRANSFDTDASRERLAGMSEEKRRDLVHDYVYDEAIYREAMALGLHDDDFVIRTRLIDKYYYIARRLAEGRPIEAEAVRAYYEKHLRRYHRPPGVSFTHVFFDSLARGGDGAENEAVRALAALNTGGVGERAAAGYGDPFVHGPHYESASADRIADHFGLQAAVRILEQPAGGTWAGPLRSPAGFHLVQVTARTEGGIPDLAEIYERVEGDMRLEHVEQLAAREIEDVVGRYEVVTP